jgi:hypothetical protein
VNVVVHEAIMIDFDMMQMFQRKQLVVDELLDQVVFEKELLIVSTDS